MNEIIKTQKLCKTFSNGGVQQHVLRNIDLSIYEGDFTVIMGASGAVSILYGKAAKEAEDPKAFLAEKEKEYDNLFTNPYQAASFGYVDDVIEPRNTRFRICRALAELDTKRESRPAKKHGNIPL